MKTAEFDNLYDDLVEEAKRKTSSIKSNMPFIEVPINLNRIREYEEGFLKPTEDEMSTTAYFHTTRINNDKATNTGK